MVCDVCVVYYTSTNGVTCMAYYGYGVFYVCFMCCSLCGVSCCDVYGVLSVGCALFVFM